jgi:hypothetical protein
MTEVNSGMQGALQHLEAADALIRKSLNWIKQQCIGGKGVSNEKLDAHQMASFDLAWCAAESTGARFAVEYAGKAAAVQTGGGLSGRADGAGVLCRGIAEHPQSLLGATAELRSERYGHVCLASSALNQFCQTQLDAGNLEALGQGSHGAEWRERRLHAERRCDHDAGFVPQAGDERGDATGGGDSSS